MSKWLDKALSFSSLQIANSADSANRKANCTNCTKCNLQKEKINYKEPLQDYIDFYNERAGIYQYEGNLSKRDSEWEAMNDFIREYSKNENIDLLNDEFDKIIDEFISITGFN